MFANENTNYYQIFLRLRMIITELKTSQILLRLIMEHHKFCKNDNYRTDIIANMEELGMYN